MYLAGYSIECKLKARLMEMYNLSRLEQLEDEIEHRLQHPVNVFTHSIEVLFTFTGARDRLLANPKRTRSYGRTTSATHGSPLGGTNPTRALRMTVILS
jgi:acid stress-induced BolA-like protein IbaG/YrbA